MADLRCTPEFEVLSAADAARRRHWSDADKLRIVRESLLGHRQVAATARRHGISRSLLTMCGRQCRSGEFGGKRSPAFIPLTLSAASPVPAALTPLPSNPEAKVEIALSNGRRRVVPANVEPEALARLLPVLERT